MTDILLERQDRVLTIRFNRPAKKHALTHAMYDALASAMESAEADPEVRVLVFRGDEQAFTAGNDLTDFLEHPPTGESSPVFRFLRAISTASKPMVAAVAGPAVGIGTTLLLHCDFAYCEPKARFALPFVNLGLTPEAGSSLLLPLAVGPKRASELLMLGEPFGAEVAREAGLITAVVELDKLFATAEETARKLAQKPCDALKVTKALLKRNLAPAIAETIAVESARFLERLDSPAAKEAFRAFFEKRAPDFSKL